jgi:hypothetical protein
MNKLNKLMINKIILPVILFLFSITNLSAETGSKSKSLKGTWAPSVKSAINNLIQNNSGQKNAYAVFDWDNTSIFGDVQEILFIYQIDNLDFKMTPDEFEYSFTHYTDNGLTKNLEIPSDNFDKSFSNVEGKQININLIAEDCCSYYKYFYEHYRGMNPKTKNGLTLEEIQKTNQFKDFKAKMWFTYEALYKSFSANVSYTWVMYVTAPGFTQKEFSSLVVKAIDWGIKRESKKVYFDSPASLKSKAGVICNTAAGNCFGNTIHPTAEMGSLFNCLEKNNIPVYISTASFQNIVEEVATNPKYGYKLPKNHAMGLRLKKDSKGKFLPEYDFSNGYVINSLTGKTININNILATKYKTNPIMIGGDSDGDYSMMTELSGLNSVKMVNNFRPLQLVLVVNRVKGGKIGEICKIATEQLYGKLFGNTVVVLQGRDENLGIWIPTEKTLRLGTSSSNNLKLLP